MGSTFGARLETAIDARGPLCVGIDPHAALLRAWGVGDDPAGLERFALTVVEALGDRVAIFKPQSAFFERHGSRGVAVLERVITEAHARGALVLLDVKRTDLGSTMQGYAEAYVDPASPLCSDAITVTPYLGFATVQPVVDLAIKHGNGVFVVAVTSNPEGVQFQEARCADGRTVAETVIASAAACNADAHGLGSVGLVIGATVSARVPGLESLNGPVLAPGVGTQGGRPADLPGILGAAARNALPSVSRELLATGPEPARLQAAAQRLGDECRAACGR